MKCRGLVVIDYDCPKGFIEAAEDQRKLQEAIDQLCRGNPRVVYHEVDLRERRGYSTPDIKNRKLRLS